MQMEIDFSCELKVCIKIYYIFTIKNTSNKDDMQKRPMENCFEYIVIVFMIEFLHFSSTTSCELLFCTQVLVLVGKS